MAIADELQERSGGLCELCGAVGSSDVYAVPDSTENGAATSVLLCSMCRKQVVPDAELDVYHWRCLSESIWSEVPVVQVMAWRMLLRLREEDWARDLAEMLYLEEDVLAWARTGVPDADDVDLEVVRHIDSNGAELAAGDVVTLIKDLNVKGTNFVAKRGTVVRGIRLVADNAAQIEGRVNGQQIVILTEFVKK